MKEGKREGERRGEEWEGRRKSYLHFLFPLLRRRQWRGLAQRTSSANLLDFRTMYYVSVVSSCAAIKRGAGHREERGYLNHQRISLSFPPFLPPLPWQEK